MKEPEYKIVRTRNVYGEFKWRIKWADGFSPDDLFDSFKEAKLAAEDCIRTYRNVR